MEKLQVSKKISYTQSLIQSVEDQLPLPSGRVRHLPHPSARPPHPGAGVFHVQTLEEKQQCTQLNACEVRFSTITRSPDCATASVYTLATFIPLSPITRQTRVGARLSSLVFSHFKKFLILCKRVINYSYKSQGSCVSHFSTLKNEGHRPGPRQSTSRMETAVCHSWDTF